MIIIIRTNGLWYGFEFSISAGDALQLVFLTRTRSRERKKKIFKIKYKKKIKRYSWEGNRLKLIVRAIKSEYYGCRVYTRIVFVVVTQCSLLFFVQTKCDYGSLGGTLILCSGCYYYYLHTTLRPPPPRLYTSFAC